MTLNELKQIWQEINRDIFAANGCPLSERPHRKTRARDYWACWDNSAEAFYWNRKLSEFGGCIRSLVAHEMVHQWQDEYMPEFYHDKGKEYNPHDLHFWGWRDKLAAHGLRLEETM